MSWNIRDNRNLFRKLKTKLGLYHFELREPEDSPKKITLTLLEAQYLRDIEKCDSEDEKSCLHRTIYKGRRKVCINFQADTDKVNIVAYRYRNDTYLKDTEIELELTEYEKLLARLTLELHAIFLSAALFWTVQPYKLDSSSVANGRSPPCKHFPILLESKITSYTQYRSQKFIFECVLHLERQGSSARDGPKVSIWTHWL